MYRSHRREVRSAGSPLARRCRARAGRNRRAVLEPLEGRLLLTADLSALLPAEANPPSPPLASIGVWRLGETTGQPTVNRLTISDADGTAITISYRGPGGGDVALDEFSRLSLDLAGTNATTALSIRTKGGDGRASLVLLHSDGPLKQFSARSTDLRGEFDLAGSVTKLQLGNLQDSSISIGGGGGGAAADLRFERVENTSLVSNSPLKQLRLSRWLDTDAAPDQLTAPSIGKLAVKGDRGTAGDLDANVTLIGSAGLTLAKADIKGAWRGGGDITGNVGTLKINQLRGALNITGDAKSVRLSDHVAIAPVASATGGSLHIGGRVQIKSAGEKLTLAGAELLTAGPDLYALADLLLYDAPAASLTYQSLTMAGKTPVSGGVLSVETAAGPTLVDGHQASVVNEESRTTFGSQVWALDSQHQLLRRSFEDYEGVVEYRFGSLTAAPGALRLRQGFSDASPMTLLLAGRPPGSLDATMGGLATIQTALLGHGEVITPAGTFLAAHVTLTIAMNASGNLVYEGQTLAASAAMSERVDLWAVPGLGVVQATTEDIVRISINGAGSATTSLKEERVLTTDDAQDRYVVDNRADNQSTDFASFGAPVIGDGGTLAFDGWLSGGVQRALALHDGQQFTQVALAGQTFVPGFGVVGNLNYPALSDGDALTFFASNGSDEGFLRYANGQWQVLASTQTGSYLSIQARAGVSQNGNLAFRAQLADGSLALMRRSGTTTTRLYDGSHGLQHLDGAAINNSGRVAFQGFVNGKEGIYAGSGGSLAAVAQVGAGFRGFDPQLAMNNAGQIAFHAYQSSRRDGIYLAVPSGVQAIATSKGVFESFSSVSINEAGQVAFLALLDDGDAGIYVGADPVRDKVVAVGDRLFGSWVANVGFSSRGLGDDGHIAFMYQLQDGRAGVAIAEPSPNWS